MKNHITNIEILPRIDNSLGSNSEVILTYQDGRRYHATLSNLTELYPLQSEGDFSHLIFHIEAKLTFDSDLPTEERIHEQTNGTETL